MSRIKSRNTKPELMLRKLLWQNKIRGYRVKTKIYGKPDVYFGRANLAVFIDGCFWHKCNTCYVRPKSNNSFWDIKIEGNVQRDIKVTKMLEEQGIKVLRLWEHEVRKQPSETVNKIKTVLSGNST